MHVCSASEVFLDILGRNKLPGLIISWTWNRIQTILDGFGARSAQSAPEPNSDYVRQIIIEPLIVRSTQPMGDVLEVFDCCEKLQHDQRVFLYI